MGKKKEEPKEKMVPLNVQIPPDMRRRLYVAKGATGESIERMVREWVDAGLRTLAIPPKEDDAPPAPRAPRHKP